jgi:hypothetical protein
MGVGMSGVFNVDFEKSPKHQICFSKKGEVFGVPAKVGIGDKNNQYYKDLFFSILEAKHGFPSLMIMSVAKELDQLFTANSDCMKSFFDPEMGHGFAWSGIAMNEGFESSDYAKLIREAILEFKQKVKDGSIDTSKRLGHYEDNDFGREVVARK